MMKEGKDINEIMKMPYGFMLDIMEEKTQPKEQKSLVSAFGG